VDLAEECLQEAFVAAAAGWASGVPDNPAGWLLTAAERRGLDRLRRRATQSRKAHLLVDDEETPPVEPAERDSIPDERLALITLCCHPALSPEARIALTLRLVGGLAAAEIARLFFVSETTMAARLTRAKHTIAAAGIPFRLPSSGELGERLGGVMQVIYLIFTEGYAPSSGDRVVKSELCAEAIRLGLVLADAAPDHAEATALTALMMLHNARRDARADAAGQIVLLRDQDRALWRWDEIEAGRVMLERALKAGRPGSYALQAAIAAEHLEKTTDWPHIAALYGALERALPSPAVRLNRAVAVAEADGPAAGLALLEGLNEALGRSSQLPATRGELLMRLERYGEAAAQFGQAIGLAGTSVERVFLEGRRAEALARASKG
jgi:RNA polymerase sigma-70 factor (ECF subfamily)